MNIKDQIPEEIVELIIEFSMCPHAGRCHLRSGVCCQCQDKRPKEAIYNVYFDGVGFIRKTTRTRADYLFERTRYYCPGCVKRIYFPFI